MLLVQSERHHEPKTAATVLCSLLCVMPPLVRVCLVFHRALRTDITKGSKTDLLLELKKKKMSESFRLFSRWH